MALALLETVDIGASHTRFRIDTGTNRYYQFRFGRALRRRYGEDWVDDVTYSSTLKENPSGGDLLSTSQEVTVPVPALNDGPLYVQLFSFKDRTRKSPAFSAVLLLPAGLEAAGDAFTFASSIAKVQGMTEIAPFKPQRKYVDPPPLAVQASWDQLLAALVNVAQPLLKQVLGNQAAGENKQADWLLQLLGALAGGLAGGGQPAVSVQKSISYNRFGNGYSQPLFAWGALIAQVAPAVLQALPQIITAMNQKRIQINQSNNNLMSELAGGINKRLMLEQLIEAQKKAPAQGDANGATLATLIQLLQQLPDSPPAQAGTAPTPTTSAGKSLALSVTPSSRAVLEILSGPTTQWNGSDMQVYSRSRPMQLSVKLSVAPPVPTRPLPKAAIDVIFKDRSVQTILYERTFQQTDVAPDVEIPLLFSAGELSRLPANRPMAVLVQMRWKTQSGARSAAAAGEIVVVNQRFVKARGPELPEERELKDIRKFRAFWHKVWESPPVEQSEKLLWELDAKLKYSVNLTTQASNGLMKTRLLPTPGDVDSVTLKHAGQMRSGIELSMTELNKLLPLWPGEQPLRTELLEALEIAEVAKAAGGEFVSNFRLKGKKRQTGALWIAPVFKLFEFTVASVSGTADSGQVIATTDENVRFPMPVAVRVIGLKSRN